MKIVHLFRSPAHMYVGHHGREPGDAPMLESARLRVLAGCGVEGDRYCRADGGGDAQITLFSEETWRRHCGELGRSDLSPAVFRRNVVVRGVDLRTLIGVDFEVQGVRFRGVEHCRPCYWMDRAFAPGALECLSKWEAGGLRARVLTDGWIEVDAGEAPACSG